MDYIQGARDDLVPTFNPLYYTDQDSGYYKVERATEIILRAWESVNIEAMPRLARWTFNAFWAAAQLGLTISDCNHFLMPGSPYHKGLLSMLPQQLEAEWEEITGSRGQEATRILDSSRNRLKPYFESQILRRIFGGSKSRLDVLRMMREGKIVIVDLAPRNRISSQIANTIGSLLINEVLAVARSLPRDVRYPTYLLLDEFQNFVGPDITSALPEVRQLGLRLILSHQSFSQLERGDYDLTDMIFQAQTRMIFGVQGIDADALAHEVASITYNSRKLKQEIYSSRQRIVGHRKEVLSAWGNTYGSASQWSDTYGKSSGNSRSGGKIRQDTEPPPLSSFDYKRGTMKTVREAAEYLGCSISNIYSLIAVRKLKKTRVGLKKGFRISEACLQAFIDKRLDEQEEPPKAAVPLTFAEQDLLAVDLAVPGVFALAVPRTRSSRHVLPPIHV